LKVSYTWLKYDGILGSMIGVVGASWSWRQRLVNIGWFAQRPVAADKRDLLIETLKKDLQFTGMAPDTYSFGKGVCRIARLALIAEELNQPDLVKQANEILHASFQPWIAGDGMDKILYDTTWFGTIPKRGLDDWHEDFGAGWYNDHHFHYGYWLYAASVLAKNNETWREETQELFTSLARDIANPSAKDPWFPRYRHFDWYAGHSWASGLMAFTDGRNQESSSECLNAWYGLYLYAKSIEDKNMQRTAASLLAHEMRAAKTYWHSTSDSSVYPEGFSQNKGVGMIWGDKVDYNTWFGAGVVYALGINMMPFTPLSEIYLDQKWMSEAYPVLHKGLQVGYTDDWSAVVYMAEAVVDAKKSWEHMKKIGHFDDGMSRSNAIWWIATRPPFNPHHPITLDFDSPEPYDPSSPHHAAGASRPGLVELHRTLIGLLLLVVLLVGVGLAIYTVLLPKLMREEGQGLLGQNPVSYDTSGTVNVF
jgi:endo-1,3(4)-beta-glucanase